MKDETFNGKGHAEELFFKSVLSEEETLEGIKSHLRAPWGYVSNYHSDKDSLIYTKRRLFFCTYNIHCDIEKYENRYRLQLYYTIENTKWTYYFFIILTALLISFTKVLAKTKDDVGVLIFFGILLIVGGIVHATVYSSPQEELLSACKSIKKELEAYVKLELEP